MYYMYIPWSLLNFQSLLLWAKCKSTLSYVYLYKGGGGLPSPHRKILGNHVQYFRSQCNDSNASIPYQCCRWLLPCCFPLTEPNSAVIALIMPQSQPTSIAFTLPMLLPLDPHYSWLWSKCCFFIYQPTHESKYYISTKVGHAIA